MSETIALVGTAVWLGILTSISPCPLATNIAAISYIGRDVESPEARIPDWACSMRSGASAAYVVLGRAPRRAASSVLPDCRSSCRST